MGLFDFFSKKDKNNEEREKLINKSILDNHFVLLSKIEEQYHSAYQTKDYFSPEMMRVIELCKKDISNGKTIMKILHDNDKATGAKYTVYNLGSTERLAVIYEKQKKYKEAIEVCKSAIEIEGITEEMQKRIKRLNSKIGKE